MVRLRSRSVPSVVCRGVPCYSKSGLELEPAASKGTVHVVHTETGHDIEKAASLLGAGELVAIPTETVYGLAANALNATAVARIFEVKNRPHFDPLIVHLPAGSGPESPMSGMTNMGPCRDVAKAEAYLRRMLEPWVREIPAWALKLSRAFWPGPLTLVLPRKPVIPDIVTSGLDTVALRIPAHLATLELLACLPFPLAAPSANPFGFVSPTCAQHVVDQLGGKIPYVLDGGPCGIGLESTIVGEVGGKPAILRLGGLRLEEIEAAIGKVALAHTGGKPLAPGNLESHYAPRTPLHFDDLGYSQRGYAPGEVALLLYKKELAGVPREQQRVLSPLGDLNEAAQKLFAAMRELDALCLARGLKAIFTQKFPDQGLGRAINDRLKRASVARAVS
jgi:L-threonylcarbamoyladenylate synthase